MTQRVGVEFFSANSRNPAILTRLFSQNSPSGLFVLRVSATDEDLGSNAKITYTLEGHNN